MGDAAGVDLDANLAGASSSNDPTTKPTTDQEETLTPRDRLIHRSRQFLTNKAGRRIEVRTRP